LYSDDKLDKNDIGKADGLKNDIADAYTREKINNEQYEELMKGISIQYEEIFKKENDSLNSLTDNEDKMKLLNKIHSDIEDAYSKEKLTEKHYSLLKEKILDYENSHSVNS
jgi:hypothetical protein